MKNESGVSTGRFWKMVIIAVIHPSTESFRTLALSLAHKKDRRQAYVLMILGLSGFLLGWLQLNSSLYSVSLLTLLAIVAVLVVPIYFFSLSIIQAFVVFGGGAKLYVQYANLVATFMCPIGLFTSVIGFLKIQFAFYLVVLYAFLLQFIALKALSNISWAKAVLTILVVQGGFAVFGYAIVTQSYLLAR